MASVRDPIKEIITMRLGDLIHNSRNWKTHPQRQKDALRGAIEELGFGDVVKAYHSKRAGGLVLLDAHARKEILPDLQVRVAIMDYDDVQADLYLMTYDATGSLAEPDAEAWLSLMEDTVAADEALQEMLDGMTVEIEGLEMPDFLPVAEEEQPKLDQRAPVTCPECGCEFSPS